MHVCPRDHLRSIHRDALDGLRACLCVEDGSVDRLLWHKIGIFVRLARCCDAACAGVPVCIACCCQRIITVPAKERKKAVLSSKVTYMLHFQLNIPTEAVSSKESSIDGRQHFDRWFTLMAACFMYSCLGNIAKLVVIYWRGAAAEHTEGRFSDHSPCWELMFVSTVCLDYVRNARCLHSCVHRYINLTLPTTRLVPIISRSFRINLGAPLSILPPSSASTQTRI